MDLLGDLLVDHLEVHLVLEGILLMSMVDTDLAWDHHLRYLGNHSLDIQMILGVQRGILHFVDIPRIKRIIIINT